MKEKDAKDLLEKLTAWSRARTFRSEEQREDFVMYAIEQILRGRTSSTWDQIRVDFLRETVAGRSDGPNYEKRMALANASGCKGAEVETLRSSQPDALEAIERSEAVERALSMRGPERAIVLLHVVHHMTEKEIGHLFGVGESRISQRLSRFKNVRAYFEDWELGDDFPLAL